MSDETPPDLRAVADFFGLRGPEPVAKDFAVLRAIGALAASTSDTVTGGS